MLDVEGRPTGPHRKLQRPGVAMIIDNAVYSYVAGVAGAAYVLFQGGKHLIREFRRANEPDYGAHFADIGPTVARHEGFEFPVLAPAGIEFMWSRDGDH